MILLTAAACTLAGGVKRIDGASGYLTNFTTAGDQATWTFTVPENTTYEVAITYRSVHGEKHQYLLLDGQQWKQQTFAQTQDWQVCKAGSVHLTAGTHTLAIAHSWGWIDVQTVMLTKQEGTAGADSTTYRAVSAEGACAVSPQECAAAGCTLQPSDRDTFIAELQLERATLHGATTASQVPGFHGSGYVLLTDAGQTVTIRVQIPSSCADPCVMGIWLRYRAPHGEKYNRVAVGESGLSLRFAPTQQWAVMYCGRWVVHGWTDILTITSEWGWVELDSLYVYQTHVPSAPSSWHPGRPVSVQSQQLMHLLLQLRAKGLTLSGQQGGDEVNHIHKITGQTPALQGFDLLNYTSAVNWHDGTPELAIKWHQQGGIVSICWHWFAPAGRTGEKSFYTKDTTFDPVKALQEGSHENKLILHDIDMISAELHKLKAAGVPVLWRPLHEAEGKWFWWGRQGPGPFKQLWTLLHYRLERVHGLDNLLWVYTADGHADVSQEWYPGDGMVDILGTDAYGQEGEYKSHARRYQELLVLPHANAKLVALSECGCGPDPLRMLNNMTKWSWFCIWCGRFCTDGKWNAPEQLRRLYAHPCVLSLEELRGLRGQMMSA